MILCFDGKNNRTDLFILTGLLTYSNTHNQFLPDDIAYQVLLCGIYMIG